MVDSRSSTPWKVRRSSIVARIGRIEYNWGPSAATGRPKRWIGDHGMLPSASLCKPWSRIFLGKDSGVPADKDGSILCVFFELYLVEGQPVKYLHHGHPLHGIRPQGALGGSNSSFNSMDGLRCTSSLGKARGYTSCPPGAVQRKVSPSGSRPLHTNRVLSAPVANRPLSPHLPLKKPQLSATFSISHRIFGVALGAAIISVPLATKFSLMFGV